MHELVLRHIATVNFNFSELTNYQKLLEEHPKLKFLGNEDVVLLRSKTGDQLVFLHGFYSTLEGAEVGDTVTFLRSERVRLLNGERWNALRLGKYAAMAGIKLAGLDKYEKHMKQLMADARKLLEVKDSQRTIQEWAKQLAA